MSLASLRPSPTPPIFRSQGSGSGAIHPPQESKRQDPCTRKTRLMACSLISARGARKRRAPWAHGTHIVLISTIEFVGNELLGNRFVALLFGQASIDSLRYGRRGSERRGRPGKQELGVKFLVTIARGVGLPRQPAGSHRRRQIRKGGMGAKARHAHEYQDGTPVIEAICVHARRPGRPWPESQSEQTRIAASALFLSRASWR